MLFFLIIIIMYVPHNYNHVCCLPAYVGDLLKIVQSLCEDESMEEGEEFVTAEHNRLPLSSACERPDKQQAIKNHITWFSCN